MFKFNENLMCSSAFTPSKYCYQQAKNESGRSMVEMLGVLAVMGILSVTAVAGFRTAMNKHHANELLNEASKRATVVAMQAAQGKTTFSIAEFGNAKVQGADFGVVPVGTEHFAITVSKMDKAVCKNVLNSVGNKSQVRHLALRDTPETKITECGEDGTAYAFVYNNDLRAVDFALDDNPDNPSNCTGYTRENPSDYNGYIIHCGETVGYCSEYCSGVTEASRMLDLCCSDFMPESGYERWVCQSEYIIGRADSGYYVESATHECLCNWDEVGYYSNASDAIAELCKEEEESPSYGCEYYYCESGEVYGHGGSCSHEHIGQCQVGAMMDSNCASGTYSAPEDLCSNDFVADAPESSYEGPNYTCQEADIYYKGNYVGHCNDSCYSAEGSILGEVCGTEVYEESGYSYFYCESGEVVKNNSGEMVGYCSCAGDGYYQNGSDAFDDLCGSGSSSSGPRYTCGESGAVYFNEQYIGRCPNGYCYDGSTILEVCDYSGLDAESGYSYYRCEGNNSIENEHADVVRNCDCSHSQEGYYQNDTDAANDLCAGGNSQTGRYACAYENGDYPVRLNGQLIGYCNQYDCKSDYGSTFRDVCESELRAVTDSLEYYHCDSGILVNGGGEFRGTCNNCPSGQDGYYDNESAAREDLCG